MEVTKFLSESMSPHVRRRLSFDSIMNDLEELMDDYGIRPYDFKTSGDFVSEICDMLNERILDDIKSETKLQVSLKEKDALYYYLVDTIGKFLVKMYNSSTDETIKESKKKYIVTESQYKRLIGENEATKLYDGVSKYLDEVLEGSNIHKHPFLNDEESFLVKDSNDNPILGVTDHSVELAPQLYNTLLYAFNLRETAFRRIVEKYILSRFPQTKLVFTVSKGIEGAGVFSL